MNTAAFLTLKRKPKKKNKDASYFYSLAHQLGIPLILLRPSSVKIDISATTVIILLVLTSIS